MSVIRRFLFICWVTSYSCIALAAYSPAAQELAAQLKGLTTMQANFKQTIATADGRVLQQASGKMALQRPGKFRWELDEPSKQLIIVSNDKLWVYDEDLAQLTVQPVNKMPSTPAFLLSTDNQHLLDTFVVSKAHANKVGKQRFILTPRHKDELFISLQLVFAKAILQQIIMTDGLGQITDISFSKAQTGQTLAAQLFRLDIPKGVELVNTAAI
jgi:outer membrane lipoprotein carrier protein